MPEDVPDFVTYVKEECTAVKFIGLMTIGQSGYNLSQGPNPDFTVCTPDRRLLSETNIIRKL